MKKIGIIGGTFNPVHLAHLILAEQAYQQYALDTIIFMPSFRPPHKSMNMVLSDVDRLAMLKLALQGNEHFTFSTLEIEKGDVSYTCETLRILQEKMPEDRLYFIIGGDSLYQLKNWYQPELIFQYAHILAASRYGYHDEQTDQMIALYRETYHASIDKILIPSMNISSHDIRNMISEGKSVKYIVQDAVIEYIQAHNLYRDQK